MSMRLSTIRGQLEVLSISAREWRVRDGSKPASDATSLLGFIGKVGELFEVVSIGRPLVRRYLGTLEDAIDDLVASTSAQPRSDPA